MVETNPGQIQQIRRVWPVARHSTVRNYERILTETCPPIFFLNLYLNFEKKISYEVNVVTQGNYHKFQVQGVPKIANLKKKLGHPVVIFGNCVLN